MTGERLFAAVDGGGSGTRAILYDESGRVLRSASGGPSNPNDIGENASCEVLTGVLAAVGAEDAGLIYCGLSGATTHERALEKALEASFPGARVVVRTDVFNLLSRLKGDGAALICGTGSVCFVRQGDNLHRIGGWGWLIDGDCGGGYALGRAGLEAALRAADGRGPQTSLYAAAAEYLGGRPEEKTAAIYDGGKPFIAAFAPRVIKAAADGDAVARMVVRRSAAGVAELLAAAHARLGDGFACVCSGGLFKEDVFRVAFLGAVAAAGIPAEFDFALAPQIAGAALAALREANVTPGAGFEKRLVGLIKAEGG